MITRRSLLQRMAGAAGLLSTGPFFFTRARQGAELIVRDGLVVTEAGRSRADVRVRDGRVIEIGPGLRGTGAQEIDAEGLLVLPGGVDPHVHLTGSWVDDFTSGSQAALAGGITTVTSPTRSAAQGR